MENWLNWFTKTNIPIQLRLISKGVQKECRSMFCRCSYEIWAGPTPYFQRSINLNCSVMNKMQLLTFVMFLILFVNGNVTAISYFVGIFYLLHSDPISCEILNSSKQTKEHTLCRRENRRYKIKTFVFMVFFQNVVFAYAQKQQYVLNAIYINICRRATSTNA